MGFLPPVQTLQSFHLLLSCFVSVRTDCAIKSQQHDLGITFQNIRLRLGDKGGKINMYLFVAATAEFAGPKLVKHNH